MAEHLWVKEFPGVVVVSDASGIIVEMNDKAVEWFASRGGKGLLGKSLFDVHHEARKARSSGCWRRRRRMSTQSRGTASGC